MVKQIAFYDIGLPNQQTLHPPASLNDDMFPAAYSVGARIHSNSWGNSNNAYNSYSGDVDLFTYNNQDFLVLFAAGNDGSAASKYNVLKRVTPCVV